MNKKRKGTFIVLDGGDGAGKGTVAKKIVEKLGWVAVHTREPGGTPYAEKIREMILSDYAKLSDAETQFALFWASRRENLKHTIIPALEAGKIVICERFDSSSYAYQVVAQGNTQLEELFWHMRDVFIGEYTPDMYILLDIDPQDGLARVQPSDFGEIDHFEKRKLEFHTKVGKGLREFILQKVEKISGGRSKGEVVDASQPLEKVIADVSEIVSKIADK